ncbi:MAG: S1 RNA-binding domain-containing protein, partial [Proteobacteria bacterium]|nr:S1 RNA-binding domain-containing protein [Pseudomonadota bacterium]
AFVNFIGNRDGLVHISELSEGRTEKVSDVVKEGDEVKVKVLEVDDRGKVRLSMRAVNQETGEDLSATIEPRPARPERGRRAQRRAG